MGMLYHGIDELSNGDLVISDQRWDCVMIFDREGSLLKRWGGVGSLGGEFHQPRGIAVLPDDTIMVCDSSNERIQTFTRKGEFIRQHIITSTGRHAYKPTGIAPLRGGGFCDDLSLADGSCIRMFDGEGKLIRQWGEYVSQEGKFKYPAGVTALSFTTGLLLLIPGTVASKFTHQMENISVNGVVALHL